VQSGDGRANIAWPMKALPPLSLYVHFPWCVSKCPYCDFNSHSLKGTLPATAYIDAVLADLDTEVCSVSGRPLISVFMGGGTPSLFPPESIDRLLKQVGERFDLIPTAEVTMEANPGTVEHGAFEGYRAAGVSRLSLGVQSFADDKLRALGRIHNAQVARRAFAEARAAGFENINIDLMYALPGQSLADAKADVEMALALRPEHISYYHLTLEPNTVFYARPPALPDDDLAWDIQLQATELLQGGGYSNYEISAWSTETFECQHNLNYWRFGDYLGIGAGAHSKITGTDGRVLRGARTAHPRDYLQKSGTAGAAAWHEVDTENIIFEFMLNNLRLRSGFSREDFERRTGLSADLMQGGLKKAMDLGLLVETQPGHLQPSARGRLFLDDLQSLFLPTGGG